MIGSFIDEATAYNMSEYDIRNKDADAAQEPETNNYHPETHQIRSIAFSPLSTADTHAKYVNNNNLMGWGDS